MPVVELLVVEVLSGCVVVRPTPASDCAQAAAGDYLVVVELRVLVVLVGHRLV